MENTSNYGLKRWDGEDRILHTEFNDNWDKIDTALKSSAAGAVSAALGRSPGTGGGAGVYGITPDGADGSGPACGKGCL